MSLIRTLLMATSLSIMVASGSAQAAAVNSQPDTLSQVQQAVSQIGHQMDQNIANVQLLQQWLNEVNKAKEQANTCIQAQEAVTQTLKTEIEALGPPVKGENWQITSKRYSLEHQQTLTAQKLASCRLLLVNSRALYSKVQARHNREMANQLLIRGRATIPLLIAFIHQPPATSQWIDRQALTKHLGRLSRIDVGLLTILTLTGLFSGIFWRQRLRTLLLPVDPAIDRIRAFRLAFLLSLNHYRPPLIITGLWSLYWLVTANEKSATPFLAFISYALFIYLVSLVWIRSVFDPPSPAQHQFNFPAALGHRFGYMLRWLSFNALFGALLFGSPLTKTINVTIILLARSLWGTLFVVNLVITIWLIRRLRQKRGIGTLRVAFSLALSAGLVAEWAGYRNLSTFLISGMVYSLVILLLAWLAASLIRDIFNSLEEGRRPWEQRLRNRLALREDGFIPGLFWLRLLLYVILWGLVVFTLLRIWGLSATGQSLLFHYLIHGFTLGKIDIVPSRVALALLVLALLLSLGSWARSELDQRLSHARMERGAREAAVAVTGYMVAILATMISLTVAGFNFQNLAIIAGALSVGIGFGLQNIVNNFVSGLILLFERPIRTGDWITVGQIEGYVRRISIRSTQVETFDRADVVVPNSDLISGPVTNWMLRDTFGRVRVPIGVAYGTDTQLVKETLLAVAGEHPHILMGHRTISDPYVLFMSFGDSALNFELRAYIKDVSDRLSVISDLNFAIDAAFRNAGISIPFPQRDIHIIHDRADHREAPSTPSETPPIMPTPPGQTPPG